MSKKVQHLVIKTTANNGQNLSVDQYLDLSPRKQKKLINRLHKKSGKGPLIMGDLMSFYWPESGIEAISTSTRQLIVIYGKRTLVENICKEAYSEIWCEDLDSFIKR